MNNEEKVNSLKIVIDMLIEEYRDYLKEHINNNLTDKGYEYWDGLAISIKTLHEVKDTLEETDNV